MLMDSLPGTISPAVTLQASIMSSHHGRSPHTNNDHVVTVDISTHVIYLLYYSRTICNNSIELFQVYIPT